jgi:GT2 family glycosyltransferase
LKVAIVILNYNGKNWLEQFLPGVLKYKPSFADVYVADNGSTDDSISFVKDKFPEVKLIALEKNYGYAGGYNQALSKIESRYYALLNSDVEIKEDWLSPLVELLDSQAEVAAVQPKIKDFKQPEYFEYAGACGGFIDMFGYPFCRGRVLDTVEKDLGQYDTVVPVFWVSGAAMLIRSSVFHEAGGFDATFFAHMEEIDLCFRMHRLGYKLMVYPNVAVYHVGGGTLSYSTPEKVKLNFRNSLQMLVKNHSTARLVWLLPARMILDGIAALLFLSQGKKDSFLSVLRAHMNFYSGFSETWKSRMKLRENMQFSFERKDLVLNGLLPLHYYVLGNKRYYTLQFKLKSGGI